MKVEIDNVSDTITKTATIIGNSAHVIVPKKWAGKQVKVSLIEETPEECLELAKELDEIRAEIAEGKYVAIDVDDLDKLFEP